MFWSKLVDALKLKPVHFLALFISSLALISLPSRALEWLGVTSIIATYRPWIGLAMLLSGCFLLSHLLVHIKERMQSWQDHRKRIGYLYELGAEEKFLLTFLVHQSSALFPVDDPIVSGLIRKDIIALGVQGSARRFPCTIHPWIQRYLRRNPDVLANAREYQPRGWLDI